MKAGDEFHIPHEGERWKIIRSSIHDGGDFIAELEMPPNKDGPPVHCHPHEDEVFEVTSGSVIISMPDGPVTVRAGETFRIPAGTPHTFKAGPDGLHARGTYNGGRFEALVAQLMPGDKKGFVRMAQHCRRTKWEGSRITNPAIRGLLHAIALVGTLIGIRPNPI